MRTFIFHHWALAVLCSSLAAAAPAQTLLRQGSNSPPGTVYHRHWLDYKAAVEKDSQGALKVELNTNEPNEATLLSNLRRGRTDCAGVSLQGAATILPEVAVLQLPYLFNSLKEVDRAYGSAPLTETFRRLFAAKGLVMHSWVEVGYTNMYGVMPIRSPADIKGLKLRATQSRASQHWIKATGAEPVVLPIAELLPGLQTGLIRGGESGVIVYDAIVNKTAPFYTLTQHAFDSGVVLCNKDWFDKLPPRQARVVLAAWDTPGLIRQVRAHTEQLIELAATRGVTIVRPNAAEQQAWRALAPRATHAVMATLGPEAAAIHAELLRLVQSTPK